MASNNDINEPIGALDTVEKRLKINEGLFSDMMKTNVKLDSRKLSDFKGSGP